MPDFDPTLKALVETVPGDWLTLLGQTARKATAIDADIATVSGAADKVIRVDDDLPWLYHLEFHAGHDGSDQAEVYHARNVLFRVRHRMCVQTMVVVLKQSADSAQFTGTLIHQVPGLPNSRDTWKYEVRRVWELDPEMLLGGGAGILPLVPISKVTRRQLPGIITRMKQRIEQVELDYPKVQTLWAATNILLGLQYDAAFAHNLLRGVMGMKESTTYQAIVEEGRKEGREEGREEGQLLSLVALIRRTCDKRFGTPNAATVAALEAITDLEQMLALAERAPTATSWQELLPTPPRRRGRRGG